MKKIFILIGLSLSLGVFAQLDITKRNVTVTKNFHVRSDTVLNATEVRSIAGSGADTLTPLIETSYHARLTYQTKLVNPLLRSDTLVRVATPKQLTDSINKFLTGFLRDRGSWNASGNMLPSATVLIGDKYTISAKGFAGDTLYVGDVIISLVNTPSQSISNWNHIPVNQPKSVNLLQAGSASIGAIKYNGLTQLAGAIDGGITSPIHTNRINLDGNVNGTKFIASDISSGQAFYVSAMTTANGYWGANSGSGSSFHASNTSANGYSFKTKLTQTGGVGYSQLNNSDAEVIKFDYTGKGTFNGGVISTGVPLDSNRINYKAGAINIGSAAGLRESSAGSSQDVRIGNGAGRSGGHGVMIGQSSGYATLPTSAGVVSIGIDAFRFNTSGHGTAVGISSSYQNTTGTENTSFGFESNYTNQTGFGNTAIGSGALRDNLNGSKNTAVGRYAARLMGLAGPAPVGNIIIGYNAYNTKLAGVSNYLIIDNNDTDTLGNFISGNMSADTLRINAKTRIGKGSNYTELFNGNLTTIAASGVAAYLSVSAGTPAQLYTRTGPEFITGYKQGTNSGTKFSIDTTGTLSLANDLTYKFRHLVAGFDSLNYTIGGTQNVYYKINGGNITVRDTLGITLLADSIKIQKAGTYNIKILVNASTSNATDLIRFKIYKNNAPASTSIGRFMIKSTGATTAATTENRAYEWYYPGLVANDILSFRVTNQTANRSIFISDFKVIISKVPE